MTEPVRVHLRVPGTRPVPELMTLIESIEAAGFDGVGILDSRMLCRDTFVILGQAATHTSRLALFPAVTNPLTRHASVLAGAIQTVEDYLMPLQTFVGPEQDVSAFRDVVFPHLRAAGLR